MRWLFPSRAPFIPSKCYASLYRYTTAPTIFALHFPLRRALSGTASLLLLLHIPSSRE